MNLYQFLSENSIYFNFVAYIGILTLFFAPHERPVGYKVFLFAIFPVIAFLLGLAVTVCVLITKFSIKYGF